MQQYRFTYDELTPLEQCIADVMLRQQGKTDRSKKKKRVRELSDA